MLAIVGLLHEAGTATEDAIHIVVENSTGSASAPLRASPTLVWRSEGYTMKAAPGRGRSCQFGSVSHRAAGNSPTRARDNRMAATCCAHSDLGRARAQHSETGGRRFRHIYDSPLHKGAAVVDRHHGRSAIAQIFDENLCAVLLLCFWEGRTDANGRFLHTLVRALTYGRRRREVVSQRVIDGPFRDQADLTRSASRPNA